MKKALLLLVLSLMLFPLVANGSGEKVSSDKEELSVIWWGSQNRHDRTIKAIELYMEKNPAVDVTYEFAGWGDYWTKVTTMAAGGMLPDVMQQDYAKLSDWVDKNLLKSLEADIKAGTLDLTNEQNWKSLYLSNGEWAYNEQGTGLGYTDDSIFVDFSKMVMSLMADGVMPDRETELALYVDKGPEAKAMVQGESAIEYFWSNQLTAMASAAGEGRNFYMTHLPRLKKDGPAANYLKPSQFFSVSAKTKNGTGAADFISFITNDLDANKILLAERGVPISSVVRAELKSLMEPAQIVAFEFIDRVSTDNSPLPQPDPVGASDVIENVYTPEFMDPMLFGLVTPEEAVATLRVRAEKILSENK